MMFYGLQRSDQFCQYVAFTEKSSAATIGPDRSLFLRTLPLSRRARYCKGRLRVVMFQRPNAVGLLLCEQTLLKRTRTTLRW